MERQHLSQLHLVVVVIQPLWKSPLRSVHVVAIFVLSFNMAYMKLISAEVDSVTQSANACARVVRRFTGICSCS